MMGVQWGEMARKIGSLSFNSIREWEIEKFRETYFETKLKLTVKITSDYMRKIFAE